MGDLDARALAEWRDLAARAAEPNPFFEPGALLPAARHLARGPVGLIVARGRSGRWIGCLPVARRLEVRDRRVPMVSGWRHPYAFLGTPLVDASTIEESTARLVEQALRVSRLGVVALPWVGEDGPVAAGLLGALAARGRQPALRRSFERAVMRRPTLDGGVESLLGRGHRRDLARLARRLAEQLDAPLELRDRSDSAAAVEEFIRIEASGWKGESGTAIASQEGHRRFFRELCDNFRADGRLQMLSLGGEGATVSCKCNLLAGDAVFCFKIAFDETFARFRPGIQMELRMLELFREGMTESWMDSCALPDSALFEHLWPERRRIASYVVASHAAVAWTINHAARAA